ncbi:MAG: DUF3006 domain-containing protein, partial [Syntrophomonas sp.]|nr:DUF3006 domain-containing protein [Syntrophomonas sp.]
FALLEIRGKEQVIKVQRAKLPPAAREGDVLLCQGEEWLIDHKATEALKKEVEHLAAELWQD